MATSTRPRAGTPVQGRYLVRLLGHQMHLQNVGKKMVITVPLPFLIERHDEQIQLVQRFQHGMALRALLTGRLNDRIA